MTLEEKLRIIDESESFADLPSDALPPSHRENYYFISYSHKDYKRVLKDIFLLESLGVNIWYDKEMHIGENWREIAELYISKFQCSGVIFYLTENSISSPACNKEVEYVLTHDKKFLSVNVPLEGRGVESGYAMLTALRDGGLECSDELLANFKKAFPDEVLYLGYDERIENKAKAILSIEHEPLFEIKKTLPLFESKESLELAACRDNTIISADLSRIVEADGMSDTVKTIGDCVFTNSINLQSVALPCGLISIGESAFRNCISLKEIDLSAQDGIKIGKNAFKGCSQLTGADLSRAKEIGEGAFSDCPSLDIDKINGDIYPFAFQNTSITKVDYLAASPRIKSRAFYGAKALREFNIRGSFSDDIGDSAFSGCEALTRVGPFVASITPTMTEKKTVSIGAYSFNGCASLTEISFKGGFDADGAIGAFWSCRALESLELDIIGRVIPDCFARACTKLSHVFPTAHIEEIGEEAFEECESLGSIDLSGAKIIKKSAFAGAGLGKIYLKSVKSIGKSAFANNKELLSVHVGADCERIESFAFLGCSALYSVKILSPTLDISKVNDVFAYTDIKEFWLRSDDVLELIKKEGVIENLLTLYVGCDMKPVGIEAYGFKMSDESEGGFLKYTRGGSDNAAIQPDADPSDKEINEPDPYSQRMRENLDNFIGREAEIKHSRLAHPYVAFVEGVKYLGDTDEVDFITLSMHDGKSFNVDGTLLRVISHAAPVEAKRIRLDKPSELDGRTLAVISNGEYLYIEAIRTEVATLIGMPKADEDGKYPVLSVYYRDEGRLKAISGADIESLTVFNESFEAIKTITR